MLARPLWSFFFFFNDTATTEIYTLSLHDALPIWPDSSPTARALRPATRPARISPAALERSEEHTSELQSQSNLVCRLLLEKKKHIKVAPHHRGTSDAESHYSSPPHRLARSDAVPT